MPKSKGEFGHPTEREFTATFARNAKGGIDAEELLKYLEINNMLLYPDAKYEAWFRVIVN